MDTRDTFGTTNNPLTGQMGAPTEGKTTSAIENVTARAPSQTWLWLAGGSILASIVLYATGKKEAGIFVGLWPPTFLIIGNYNKMVKQHGSG